MPSIFLLKGESTLEEMIQQPYESEALLQKLLSDHPGILAGDQFHGPEPKRWLLIRQEVGVPAEQGGADRWSLDHLFVDQNGMPTLVEVKRGTDNRIRREVVGQMLGYAANAVSYWPERKIRSCYESDCERDGKSIDEQLATFLRLTDDDPERQGKLEKFWDDVDLNLRAGRIRMVFVADTIPPELRRIVEFLNEQMDPAEVLAIEIKKFEGLGVTTFVPTVIGQTAQATAIRASKSSIPGQWDRDTFFEALRVRKGEQACQLAETLLESCKTLLPVIWWGKGSVDGSCYAGITYNGNTSYLFSMWTYGKIEIPFQHLKRYAPFDLEATRIELLTRLQRISGVTFGPEVITRRPTFELTLLANPEAMAKFHDAVEWAVSEMKRV